MSGILGPTSTIWDAHPFETMPLTVSDNYTGIEIDNDLLSWILKDLRYFHNNNIQVQFRDGPYELHLGPYQKEYIVRLKNNVVLSCERFHSRDLFKK